MPSGVPSGRTVARTVFVAALAGLCVWTLWRFIPALTWSVVIAVATWPLRERMVASGLSPAATAALLTVCLALLAISPFALFGAEIARDAETIADVIGQARHGHLQAPNWLSGLPLVGHYAEDWWHAHFTTPEIAGHLPGQSPSPETLQWGRQAGQWLVRRLVVLGFTLLSLLFIYRDGPQLATDAERLALRLFGAPAKRYGRYSVSAVRATVNGLLFVALGEGLVLAVGYILFGVPHPVLFGAATAVLAIIPFGAPVVLAVASLVLIAGSRTAAAALLFVVGCVLIVIVDHTVRPALIGGSIRLPFFWALLGVFGGLETFGLVGLFVGPAIISIALTIWREALETASMDQLSSR